MLACLISNLFNKSTKDKNIHGCEGKKTALLQTLVVYRLARFANVLFCALAVDKSVPKCAQKAQCAGGKKIKTPCRGVSKSINPVCIFICNHCQVSDKVSQSGVWLAPNADV
jgi:hypothetical protein